jgi:hypothetical protein
MKTQPVDTHPEVEGMLVHLIRNAPVHKRFRLVQSLTQGALWSNVQAWRERHPKMSEQAAAVQAVSCWYGSALAAWVETALAQREQWSLQPIDLLNVMLPALQLFQERNIFCYLGGSIASSLHGMQQMVQDIDLVINLDDQDLSSLLSPLKQAYVFDEEAFQEAVHRQMVCPLIHLDTLMKVDLVMAKQTALESALQRCVIASLLDERYPSFRVASAVEMILIKLLCYTQDLHTKADGMRDDAEWNDLVGMLKVQGPNLERDFLEDWARRLKITETLRQALVDAGVEHGEAAGSREKGGACLGW